MSVGCMGSSLSRRRGATGVPLATARGARVLDRVTRMGRAPAGRPRLESVTVWRAAPRAPTLAAMADLRGLLEGAVHRARRAGAWYAEARHVDELRDELAVRDGAVEKIAHRESMGVGVR